MTTLLGLDLTGRLAVAVGGGPVSGRRVRALLDDGAVVRLVSPTVSADLDALLGHERLTWRRREVTRGDLSGAWLVHTATGQPAVDARVAAWADELHLWCINAGDSARGSARTPAVARESGLVLGVVSDGAPDPRRSAAVRDSLAEQLRSGDVALRRARPKVPGSGRVILVGGGPGDPELITVRGRRALARADVVVADRLGPRDLLGALPADVEIVDVGKSVGHHPVPQEQINRILIEHAQAGCVVVRLKGGDPFVLGRGGEEALACQAAGIPVEVVPGISSAIAVPAAGGIPVTHRGVSAGVHVVTGHGGLTSAEVAALRDASATVVVLMGVGNLARISDQALRGGAAATTPVAIIERGTLPDQKVVRTVLAELTDERCKAIGTPAVIVLGDVAAMDLRPALVPDGPVAPVLDGALAS